MKQFLKEAWIRLNSDTPIFFKKVGRAGIGLVAMAGGLVTPLAVGATMPPTILTIAKGLAVAGGVMKAIASFACTSDPNQK